MKKATLTLLCLSLSIPCYARTITITPDGTGDYPTIQAAINAANDGDEIVLNPGRYTGYGNRDIDYLGKAITVRSENGPENCIIDCNASSSEYINGFKFQNGEDANSVLDGLTIKNANYSGIDCSKRSSPTVKNCIISNNSSSGIACYSASPTIKNCRITDNTADSGGGICCYEYSSPIIHSCIISGNSAEEGSGIYAFSVEFSKLTVTNSAIINNYGGGGGIHCRYWSRTCDLELHNCYIADNEGRGIVTDGGNLTVIDCHILRNNGGITNSGGTLVVKNCTITDNSAGRNGGAISCRHVWQFFIDNCIITGNSAGHYGGAIFIGSSIEPSVINNCIITGNSAGRDGGAIFFDGGKLTVNNCTITGNLAAGKGGAIFYSAYRSNSLINNCIIRDNLASEGSQIWFGGRDATLTLSYTDIHFGDDNIYLEPECTLDWGRGNFAMDPCFVEPGYWDPNGAWIDGDYHLLATSPCINAGDPNNTAIDPNATDIDGDPRIINGRVDVGADESPYEGFQLTFIVDDDGPADFNTIRAAINAARDDDTVVVAPGTYTGEGNRDLDFLRKAITVRSTDPNDPNVVENTIIDCNGTEEEPHRGFYFHYGEDANSILNGLTITNGYASSGIWLDYCGGAILLTDNSSPTITNCTLSENTATSGGGIFIRNCKSIIQKCTFKNNYANYSGGGLCHFSNNSSTLECCIFTNNKAGSRGGGMFFFGTDLFVNNCIFNNNTSYQGGGLSSYPESPDGPNSLIQNCVFKGNSAEGDHAYGGAVYLYVRGVTTLDNCIFSGNRVTGLYEGGGAIYCRCELPEGNYSTMLLIQSCTITDNASQSRGGGLELNDGPIFLNNSIVWGNSAKEGKQIFTGCIRDALDIYYNNIEGGLEDMYYGCSRPIPPQINWGPGNIDHDPCFVEPGYWVDANDPNIIVEPNDPNAFWLDGDYHLLAESPCINAGDPNHPYDPNEKDLDGKPRIINGRIDMGAYEFSHIPIAVAGPRAEPDRLRLARWIC